jgi:hypothetical protein
MTTRADLEQLQFQYPEHSLTHIALSLIRMRRPMSEAVNLAKSGNGIFRRTLKSVNPQDVKVEDWKIAERMLK